MRRPRRSAVCAGDVPSWGWHGRAWTLVRRRRARQSCGGGRHRTRRRHCRGGRPLLPPRRCTPRPQGTRVPQTGCGGARRARASRLEDGEDGSPWAPGFALPGGGPGRVAWVGAAWGALGLTGRAVWSGGTTAGAAPRRTAREGPYGPGRPGDAQRLVGMAQARGHREPHGWRRAGMGHRLGGAPRADRAGGAGGLQGLYKRPGSTAGTRSVLAVLHNPKWVPQALGSQPLAAMYGSEEICKAHN